MHDPCSGSRVLTTGPLGKSLYHSTQTTGFQEEQTLPVGFVSSSGKVIRKFLAVVVQLLSCV